MTVPALGLKPRVAGHFGRFPQSRRFVPEDPKELAVYEIRPVAIALVDYASGFGTTHLVELWP